VVKDERHLAPAPDLPLSAELAGPSLHAGLVEATLECVARIGRISHQDLLKRTSVSRATVPLRGVRIEVIRRYPPAIEVLSERDVIAARGPHPEEPQDL